MIMALFRRFPPLSALVMRVVAIFAVPIFVAFLWIVSECLYWDSCGQADKEDVGDLWGRLFPICPIAVHQFPGLRWILPFWRLKTCGWRNSKSLEIGRRVKIHPDYTVYTQVGYVAHSPLNVDGSALWIAYMGTLLLGCSLMEISQPILPLYIHQTSLIPKKWAHMQRQSAFWKLCRGKS